MRKLSNRCLPLYFIVSYFNYKMQLLWMTHVTVWRKTGLLCLLNVAHNWKSINFNQREPSLGFVVKGSFKVSIFRIRHLQSGHVYLLNLHDPYPFKFILMLMVIFFIRVKV